MSDTVSAPTMEIKAVQVLYCGICTFPPEYCEFGSHVTRCKGWLQESHPQLYEKYWSDDALSSKIGTLSVEAQAKLEQDTAKKELKAEAKAELDHKKKMASKVIIKRIERNKRKHVTSVTGLEAFGVDLKKAAKVFAQKFATGASVAKTPGGGEEIVVQGDVSDDILEMIEEAETKGQKKAGSGGILEGVPSENVSQIEEKKKKGAPDG